MANTDIEEIDSEIIRWLQQDARIAVATIAGTKETHAGAMRGE